MFDITAAVFCCHYSWAQPGFKKSRFKPKEMGAFLCPGSREPDP